MRLRERERKTTLTKSKDLFQAARSVELGVKFFRDYVDKLPVHRLDFVVSQRPLVRSIFRSQGNGALIFADVFTLVHSHKPNAAQMLELQVGTLADQITETRASIDEQRNVSD